MSSRPTYSDEFKADAVALADSSGRPLALVAAELGSSLTALKHWVKLSHEDKGGAGQKPEGPEDAAKYKSMKARLREVEREKELLKKFQRSSPKNNGRWHLPLRSAAGERRRKDRVDVPATLCATVLVLPLA
ncbi:transposase [Arthrobacter sp. HLT1-20]